MGINSGEQTLYENMKSQYFYASVVKVKINNSWV